MAVLAVSATAAVTMFAAPAHAATNPYSPAAACNNDFGGSWSSVSDGHRTIMVGSTKLGDVYLMYNNATGYNCVATIKAVSVGTATEVRADLGVDGDRAYFREGKFKYYETLSAYARGRCVYYAGYIDVGGSTYGDGRLYFGNCG